MDQKYKQISKQLSEALYLQQRRWGRGSKRSAFGRIARTNIIRLLVRWYAEGSVDAYGALYDEVFHIITGGPLVDELQLMVDTLPKEIRSTDWVGINNYADYDDGITEEERVAQELEGRVNFYGYIKYLYAISY